jgi:hypothetical protein
LKERFSDREDHLKSFMPIRKEATELMGNLKEIAHLSSEDASNEAKTVIIKANERLAKIIETNQDKKE